MEASLAVIQRPQAGASNTVITVSGLVPACFVRKVEYWMR